tara:strand:- start:5862 stop:8108 length:2247 start_codon:yes stop_codon:yes gene_type:complete
MFYTAGYLMARERLFQMTVNAATTEGTLSKLFGESQLKSDIFLRTWGIPKIAEELVNYVRPESREVLETFCNGVNAYIDEIGGDLPVEFKLLRIKPIRWEPKHVTGYARLMAYSLSQSWYPEMMLGQVAYMFGEKKALELWPVAPDESPESLPTVAFDLAPVWEAMSVADENIRRLLGTAGGHLGSNSWVVSGARTKSGKPILSNDPHLGMTQPSIWYEMHLVGGEYDVSGVCFPGTPFVILGQNRNAAWGFTNLMTDDLDFYVEKVNPDNSNQYYYDGIWKEMILRDEQIPVKGGKTQTLLVRETHRGPVISDLHPLATGGDRVISFRWTGREMSDEVDAFLRLNTMENWREFSEAVSRFTVPGQNIIYADTKGNIGWRPGVRIPKRKGGETLVPLPGETSEYDWKGFVKSSALPRLYNPPTGIIATANHRTIPDNSPYYVSSLWHEKSRHDRISELLDGRSNLTVDDMIAIQQDVVSPFGQNIAPYFIKAFENETVEENSNLHYAINVLGEWTGGFEPESVGGLIFSTVMLELLEAVYMDEMALLGDDFFLAWIGPVGARGNWAISLRNLRGILERGGSSWVDDVRTPDRVENLDEIIRKAFRSAVAELETRLGPSPGNWWWGRLHTLTHVHTIGGTMPLLDRLFGFNVGPFESGGSSTTINNGEYTLSAPFQRVVGPSFRRIVDLSDMNSTQFVLPTGQSGLPRSPHYADQAPLYMSGRYRTTLMDEATVRNSGFPKLVLKPSVQ